MDSGFIVTISQVPSGDKNRETGWRQLVSHVSENQTDLVVLPEMPFFRWLPGSDEVSEADWNASVETHEEWLGRLEELAPATVASSRPVTRSGRFLNEGFVWDSDHGYRIAHHKAHLPDEDGFWEASWYDSGPAEFEPVTVGTVKVGFLICTELWDMERAREYGRKGAHLLITPRATEVATGEKWLAAGRTSAVIAGAFSLSANRSEATDSVAFGGHCWCYGPDGERLAVTNEDDPIVTVATDPIEAKRAKKTYPRYAIE